MNAEPIFLVAEVALIALVGALFVLVIAWPLWHLARGTFRPRRATDPAVEELRVRFARGEIDRDEFEERRVVLRGGR